MKKLTTIMMFLAATTAFAQFPAPTDLDFSYTYYMIGDSGPCDDDWVYGPSYCSYFSWNTPDTNERIGTLEYYNLYYAETPGDTNSELIISVVDTTLEINMGFIGYMWVTAVYSNPDGESGPSNIVENTDLPLGTIEMNDEQKQVYYDQNSQSIILRNTSSKNFINIYNLVGQQIGSYTSGGNSVDVSSLQSGIYIMEVFTTDNDVLRQKFLK